MIVKDCFVDTSDWSKQSMIFQQLLSTWSLERNKSTIIKQLNGTWIHYQSRNDLKITFGLELTSNDSSWPKMTIKMTLSSTIESRDRILMDKIFKVREISKFVAILCFYDQLSPFEVQRNWIKFQRKRD